MRKCIIQRLEAGGNHALDIANMITIHPAQGWHAVAAAHLVGMRRKVSSGAKFERAGNHLLQTTTQSCLAQTMGVTDENAPCIVRVGSGDVVHRRAKLPVIEMGQIEPHISSRRHVFRVLAWAASHKLHAFIRVDRIVDLLPTVGVRIAHGERGRGAVRHLDLVLKTTAEIHRLAHHESRIVVASDTLDGVLFGLRQCEQFVRLRELLQRPPALVIIHTERRLERWLCSAFSGAPLLDPSTRGQDEITDDLLVGHLQVPEAMLAQPSLNGRHCAAHKSQFRCFLGHVGQHLFRCDQPILAGVFEFVVDQLGSNLLRSDLDDLGQQRIETITEHGTQAMVPQHLMKQHAGSVLFGWELGRHEIGLALKIETLCRTGIGLLALTALHDCGDPLILNVVDDLDRRGIHPVLFQGIDHLLNTLNLTLAE